MSGYLLDTNAISLLAPRGSRDREIRLANDRFADWVREHGDELYLSAITLAEIQAGISALARKGAHKRATDLAHWLQAILELYGSRIVPLDPPIALATGRLLDRAIGLGGSPGFEDAAIAATAEAHDLVVVTANVRHFEPFGVAFMAPPRGAPRP